MENRIYSRKRFFKNINYVLNRNNKSFKDDKNYTIMRKLIKIVIVVIIAVSIANKIISVIEPTMDLLCINMAKSIATQISNEQATNVMNKYKYDDISTIIRNEQGNIEMIKMNIVIVNDITSDIALKIQKSLNEYKSDDFSISLGSFSGLKILSGRGPQVPIKMSTVGNVDTNLVSNFSHTGINDTLHRVYLNIECKVIVLTPYDTIEQTICNQILLAEAVIVGEVPETYYNLNGMEDGNLTDVIK